ncbi:MAG: ribosome silencing factor [Cytophagales bacterium]|nr:MAG: ribosome silencing factor [Cytophagales bacterium]
MRETVTKINSDILCQLITEGMQDKKGINIVVLDLRQIRQAITDFFVICSGSSPNHIEAIADAVEDKVYKTCGELPWQREGKEQKEWILLDYVDVVVHVFRKERRDFYAIEDLWGDAPQQQIASDSD